MTINTLILGAAGRDFHDFNTRFRGDPSHRVVGFTAAQIPDIDGRVYPPELAGAAYPEGIPIFDEAHLADLIARLSVDKVVFSYSDVSHQHVMHLASQALAAGAGFELLSPRRTMLKADKPVVAVCAARTGSGKTPVSRLVASTLEAMGRRVVVVRHPMPYGDLAAQAVQRFASEADLEAHRVTFEEREEYEPHIEEGRVVFAGVDYAAILEAASVEGDVILWDGGNNDLPFYAPDLHLVLVDALRADHAGLYHPGEANVRMADVAMITKVDSASLEQTERARRVIASLNPEAQVIEAVSPLAVEESERIRGSRVLVVEDGPTVTHGEMAFGAGWIAARRFGAEELVDPRPWAQGSIRETFRRYRHLRDVLPAVGYGDIQIHELEATIRQTPADLVVYATPMDLGRRIRVNKPMVRVRYDVQVIGQPTLEAILNEAFSTEDP